MQSLLFLLNFSYVSMEEHLASCESHLQERIGEVKSAQKKVHVSVVTLNANCIGKCLLEAMTQYGKCIDAK